MSQHPVGSPQWREERIASVTEYGRRRVARLDITDDAKTAYLEALATEIPNSVDATAAELLGQGRVDAAS